MSAMYPWGKEMSERFAVGKYTLAKTGKNGIWQITHKWGKYRRLVSTRQTCPVEACKFMVGYIEDGTKFSTKETTVEQVLLDYEAEHVEKKVVAKERFMYAKESLWPLRSYQVHELTDAIIQGWVYRRDASDGTIRRELGVLKAAINHARKRKRLTESDMPFFDIPERPPAKVRCLTRDELDRLMDQSRYVRRQNETGESTFVLPEKISRLRRFLMIAYWTAGRRAAIENLRWDGCRQRSAARCCRYSTNLSRPWYALGWKQRHHGFLTVQGISIVSFKGCASARTSRE